MLRRGLQRLISHRLFKRDQESIGPWHVIGWWEVRRGPYNLIVGITGLVSILSCVLSVGASTAVFKTELPTIEPSLLSLFLPLVYAIFANICYTGGWFVELIASKLWQEQSRGLGPVSFALGLVFSVLLTLLPAFVALAFIMLEFVFGPFKVGAD